MPTGGIQRDAAAILAEFGGASWRNDLHPPDHAFRSAPAVPVRVGGDESATRHLAHGRCAR